MINGCISYGLKPIVAWLVVLYWKLSFVRLNLNTSFKSRLFLNIVWSKAFIVGWYNSRTIGLIIWSRLGIDGHKPKIIDMWENS